MATHRDVHSPIRLKSYAPLQKALNFNDFFHADYNANERRFVALRNDDQRWFSSSSLLLFSSEIYEKSTHKPTKCRRTSWHTFPLNKKFFFIFLRTQFVESKRDEKKPERIFFFLHLYSAASFKFIYLLFSVFNLREREKNLKKFLLVTFVISLFVLFQLIREYLCLISCLLSLHALECHRTLSTSIYLAC